MFFKLLEKLNECKTLMHELCEVMTDDAEFAVIQPVAQKVEQALGMSIEGMTTLPEFVEALRLFKRLLRLESEVAMPT